MMENSTFTNIDSALGAVPRLLDIGVLPDIMSGNIIGIVAQRLVRKLCDRCKEPYSPSDLERALLGISDDTEQQTLHRAVGCSYHLVSQSLKNILELKYFRGGVIND